MAVYKFDRNGKPVNPETGNKYDAAFVPDDIKQRLEQGHTIYTGKDIESRPIPRVASRRKRR